MSNGVSSDGDHRLPSTFIAYPSDEATADNSRRLAEELREIGGPVVTWEALKHGVLLWHSIQSAIDECALFLADTTTANPNVTFEPGYAIATGKQTLELRNALAAKAIALRPLEIVRHIRYEQRLHIVGGLVGFDFSMPTLAEPIGIHETASAAGGLYFIPSRNAGDINGSLWTVCQKSLYRAKSVDVSDSDYESLASQARSTAAADLVVCVLVSEDTRDFERNNAEVMLYAGLAAGLKKDYVVVGQLPIRRMLDSVRPQGSGVEFRRPPGMGRP